jgi:hypothetical protein
MYVCIVKSSVYRRVHCYVRCTRVLIHVCLYSSRGIFVFIMLKIKCVISDVCRYTVWQHELF